MVAQYAQHVADDDDLVQFFREVLIREEFLPVVDTWEEQIAAGETPTPLLEDEDYLEAQFGPFRAAQAEAEDLERQGSDASDNSSDYVLVTLLLATALFFAGVTTTFRLRLAQVLLLGGATLALAVAAARIAEIPQL